MNTKLFTAFGERCLFVAILLTAFIETKSSAATFTVNTVLDGAPGSLRSAIAQANALPGLDVIVFNFSSYPVTLTFNSALPDITDSVIIDGTSGNPCASAPVPPRIQLDGIGLGANVDGLVARGSAVGPIGVTIKGLAIYRFPGAGIRLERNTNSVITGNNLGTDASGMVFGIGNGNGIIVNDSTNVVIGGSATICDRNVISGNSRGGVDIFAGADNRVVGNIIGLRGDGLWPMANQYGAGLTAGARNRIGSTLLGEANVISGNRQSGVQLNGPLGMRMEGRIEGNFIGTRGDGSFPVPNGADGVYFFGGPTGNFVEQNTIAFNLGAGVNVLEGTDNTIVENSIFNNNQLGIDITPDFQPNPNDNCDQDNGPNRLQNYPMLGGVLDLGASVQIDGMLNSEPNKTFRIDFYWSPSCDPFGFGEGRHYIGQTSVSSGIAGACDANFSVTFPVHVPAGAVVTATATHPEGSTSEFSPCATVLQGGGGGGVNHAGLPHAPLGASTLTETNGWLDVSGINGGGGMNGVRIALGRAQGWQGALDSFTLNAGDTFTTRVMSQIGSNSMLLASANLVVNSNTISFRGDFNFGGSNLPPRLRMEFRDDDGRLLATFRMTNGNPYGLPPCAPGQNPEVCSNAFVSLQSGEPAFWWKFCHWICMPCPGCDPPVYLPVRVACLVAETNLVRGNCLVCPGGNGAAVIELVPKLGANNINGGHFRLGQEWVQQFGEFHQELQGTMLEAWNGSGGGDEGGGMGGNGGGVIHITLPQSPTAPVEAGAMLALDRARHARIDLDPSTFTSFDWRWLIRNCTNPITPAPDWVQVQAANPGANINFGFPLSGASTGRLDFYHQGNLVGTMNAFTDTTINASSPPIRGARATSMFTPLGTAGFGLYWPQDSSLILVLRRAGLESGAGESFTADEMRITPINPATPPPWLSRIDVLAAGVPSFEITSEETRPAVPGPLTIQRAGPQVHLSYLTERGRPYVLQFKTSLNSTQWQTLDNFTGDGAARVVNDSTSPNQTRFYRLGGL